MTIGDEVVEEPPVNPVTLPCTCLYSPDHPEHWEDPECPTHRTDQ